MFVTMVSSNALLKKTIFDSNRRRHVTQRIVVAEPALSQFLATTFRRVHEILTRVVGVYELSYVYVVGDYYIF